MNASSALMKAVVKGDLTAFKRLLNHQPSQHHDVAPLVHRLVRRGHTRLLAHFLTVRPVRACVLARNSRGDTLLHVASACGRPEVLRMLLDAVIQSGGAGSADEDEYAHITDNDDHKMDAVDHTMSTRDLLLQDEEEPEESVTLHEVLNIRNRRQHATPLMLAARDGRITCVRELLAYGADPNCVTKHKRSAAFLAVQFGHVECLLDLVAGGANVLGRDAFGQSLLWKAAQRGQSACLQALLRLGCADMIDLTADGNWTPLAIAVREGHAEVVRCLLRHNASLRGPKCQRLVPMALKAPASMEVARVLLEYGAPVDLSDRVPPGIWTIFAQIHTARSQMTASLRRTAVRPSVQQPVVRQVDRSAAHPVHNATSQVVIKVEPGVDDNNSINSNPYGGHDNHSVEHKGGCEHGNVTSPGNVTVRVFSRGSTDGDIISSSDSVESIPCTHPHTRFAQQTVLRSLAQRFCAQGALIPFLFRTATPSSSQPAPVSVAGSSRPRDTERFRLVGSRSYRKTSDPWRKNTSMASNFSAGVFSRTSSTAATRTLSHHSLPRGKRARDAVSAVIERDPFDPLGLCVKRRMVIVENTKRE